MLNSPPLSVSLQWLFWYISVIDFLFPLLTIATLFLSVTKQNKAPVGDYIQIYKLHHIQMCFYFSLSLCRCFEAGLCFTHVWCEGAAVCLVVKFACVDRINLAPHLSKVKCLVSAIQFPKLAQSTSRGILQSDPYCFQFSAVWLQHA